MLPSSCLSQVLLSLTSPPPQTQARHVPFSETQREMGSGSFRSSVVTCTASMCVILGPITEPQKRRRGKGQRELEKGKEEG